MKRFAYQVGGKKDKFTEKASKEDREYSEALRGEKRAQEEGKSLTEQLQAALHTKSQFEPPVTESNQAQQELDDLYNAIFEGQTVSFPEEDAQEMAAMQAHNQAEHLHFILSRETQVKQMLADARVSMIEALSRVEGALDNSRVDMFGDGALWDYLERRDLGESRPSHQRDPSVRRASAAIVAIRAALGACQCCPEQPHGRYSGRQVSSSTSQARRRRPEGEAAAKVESR